MAATHTGALAGEYPVYRDVLRQVGVRVVDTLGAMVVALSLRDKFGIWPQQRDLAVMAISGGVAGQVADECHLYQIPLATLEPTTLDAIRAAKASIEPDNPVDLSPAGSQNSDGFITATRAFLSDPKVGAGLYVHAQAMPDKNLVVQLGLQDSVVEIAQGLGLPLVLSQLTYSLWSAEQHQYYRGYQQALAVTVLEDAIAGLAAWRGPTEQSAESTQPSGLDDSPQWHNEFEVKRMLASAGVQVPRAELIPADQVETLMSVKLKGPLVLKGVGLKIYHKNRLGLVRLGLRSKSELKRAVLEMAERRLPVEGWLIEQEAEDGVDAIISIVRQPLGDVLMIGLGGVDVETTRSIAFAVLPVSRVHLVKMLARANLPPAVAATVNKLIAFYGEHGLATLECNPVRITGDRATVLDVVATK
jgi:acetate---CoA ligase (ADP-forming)